ncbi:MAG TPA: NUDIX hydrolase [Gemmatimonadales bacterium]|nr:NUDIX hydrolase [Gemmatimonadales bacterium]
MSAPDGRQRANDTSDAPPARSGPGASATDAPLGRLASRRIYTGRVLNLDVDTVRFPDGTSGELEMIRHPGAAAVLPVLTADGSEDPQILLIRQYRYAAGGNVWEIPAGRLEEGESPEACARRELLEETGATAGRWDRMTTIYTTPGFTDERIHIFAARDLVVRPQETRREPDEFMEVKPVTVRAAIEMIRDGEVVDGKTIVAVLFYAGFQLGL